MKLNDLAPVLASAPGRIQDALLYERSMENYLLAAPIEHVIRKWPDFDVENIRAAGDKLIICGYIR